MVFIKGSKLHCSQYKKTIWNVFIMKTFQEAEAESTQKKKFLDIITL